MAFSLSWELMLYVGVLALVTFFVSGSVPEAYAKESARELAGEIVSVEGSVFVRPDGRVSTLAPKPAKAGDPVYSGDVVNTPSNGKIKMLMVDKSIIDLGPSALFKVDHFAKNKGDDRQADMSMMYGTLRAAVTKKITGKGRFNIRTPAATMGVRGTEFVVKSEIKDLKEMKHAVQNPGKSLPTSKPAVGKTEVTVIQGKVDVQKTPEKPLFAKEARRGLATSEKVVSLTAGTQLVTQQGEVVQPKPVVLDTKQLAVITQDVKVQDNTFQKAVVIDTSATQGSGDADAGEATRNALNNVLVVPVAPQVSVGDVGFAGTFGVTSSFNSGVVTNQPMGMRTLRVRVVVQ